MNIIELIGNTPLVELRRLNPAADRVQLFGKLESRNPGGSIKDRVALSMVEAGERSGELTQDKILLEATSGNTGIGMAMMCAAKRYRCQLIMPESASIERRLIMQAYGAEIILTPAKRKPTAPSKRPTRSPASTRTAISSPTSSTTRPTGWPITPPPPRRSGPRPKGG